MIEMTRDLFDEMLEATRLKERQRIVELLREAGCSEDVVAVVEGSDE